MKARSPLNAADEHAAGARRRLILRAARQHRIGGLAGRKPERKFGELDDGGVDAGHPGVERLGADRRVGLPRCGVLPVLLRTQPARQQCPRRDDHLAVAGLGLEQEPVEPADALLVTEQRREVELAGVEPLRPQWAEKCPHLLFQVGADPLLVRLRPRVGAFQRCEARHRLVARRDVPILGGRALRGGGSADHADHHKAGAHPPCPMPFHRSRHDPF